MALVTAPAGRSSTVAGAYRATWGGLDLGKVTQDGFSLRTRTSSIDIMSDITGETIVDSIHTGVMPTITMTLQDWNAQAVEAMIWWFGTLRGLDNYQWGETDGVGLNEWANAKPLILTACHATIGESNTVALANPTIDPLQMIIYKTILQSDQDIEVLLSHRPRFITVTLKILAVSLNGDSPSNFELSRVNDCGSVVFWNAVRNTGAHLGATPTPVFDPFASVAT